MTAPIDALVAEAIAKAEAEVGPLDDEGNAAQNNGQDDAFMHERTAHIALAHLATRAAEAEGRAERAEARVRDFVTTILDYGYSEADGLGYVVVGDGDDPDDLPNLIEYARQIRKEDAEKEAPHG